VPSRRSEVKFPMSAEFLPKDEINSRTCHRCVRTAELKSKTKKKKETQQ